MIRKTCPKWLIAWSADELFLPIKIGITGRKIDQSFWRRNTIRIYETKVGPSWTPLAEKKMNTFQRHDPWRSA